MSARPVALNEARNEMRRLTRILLDLNKKFLEREKQVVEFNRTGRYNYSGNLSTVLESDIILGGLSGGAKTVSTLVQGLAAYIQAEVAMKQLNMSNPVEAEFMETLGENK